MDQRPKSSSPKGILDAVSPANHALDNPPGKHDTDDSHTPEGSNEHSPLLTPRESHDLVRPALSQRSTHPMDSEQHSNALDTSYDSPPKSRTSWYLLLLTIVMFGLQIAWSTELAYGSPYLLSLGISKSLLAFVWIAGPLSGVLVAPYIGAKSDRCRSRFGKRRPFMLGGGIATVVCFLALAWTKEIIGAILVLFGVSPDSPAIATTAIVFAIILIYVLDFAINTIQAATRAFIVDNVPDHQQDVANAWASRISGVGNITGYLFGYVDLPKYLWFAGNTQFKILCAFASLAVFLTLTISCFAIKERDPRNDDNPPEESGALAVFRSLWRSASSLPVQIRRICSVQFLAWMGWFPFLFYITTYVGGVYAEPYFAENPEMSNEEIEQIWQKATRVATFAMFIFAIVSFLTSVLFPFLIVNSAGSHHDQARSMSGVDEDSARAPLTLDDSNEGTSGPATSGAGISKDRASAMSNPLNQITRRLPSLKPQWLTLRLIWMLSLILFFILMWSTLFIRTTTAATVLLAFLGIPWAITQWAPFALIAAEISKRKPMRRQSREAQAMLEDGSDSKTEDTADQAGVILGIHNVAISAPQIIASLLASVVFHNLQKPRGSPNDDSVAWTLRMGGSFALVAAWLASRVADPAKSN